MAGEECETHHHIDKSKPKCHELRATVDKKNKLQSYKVLNFNSVENQMGFLEFLARYIEFTEQMIYFVIYVGDMVEQAIRLSNLDQFDENNKVDNLIDQIKVAIRVKLLNDNKPKDGSDEGMGSVRGVFFGTDDNLERDQLVNEIEKYRHKFAQSVNNNYKFISIDELTIFRNQYSKSVNQLIQRMYKSIFGIYSMFPDFNNFEELSIFDKAY